MNDSETIMALFWLKLINIAQFVAQAIILIAVFYAGFVFGGLK